MGPPSHQTLVEVVNSLLSQQVYRDLGPTQPPLGQEGLLKDSNPF